MDSAAHYVESSPDLLGMDVAPAGTYVSLREAEDHGLVVLSMRLPYWVQQQGTDFSLYVPTETADRVSRELREYEQEQAIWARQLREARALPEYPAGVFMPYIYVLVLFVGYWFQLRYDPYVVEHGANSAWHVAVEHEWWRPLTALFLHGDWLHLISNAASGLLFGVLVAGSLGPRRGWMLILLAGFLGNAGTAMMRPLDDPMSIGASTAVFGALGILTAYGVAMAFRIRRFFHHNVVSKLVPLAGGMTLLGLTGFGGGNTDVLAHVNGFAAGLLIGTAAGILQKSQPPRP